MSQFYDQASLVVVPSGYKAGTVYAQKPLTTDGQLAFTRTGDTATRVNSAGLIEKVRTNLLVQSNTFNVTWDNIGTSETSGQAGYDGTNNAWSLVEDSSTGNHLIRSFPSVTGLSTISIYAKAGTRNWFYLRGVQSSANVIGWFNLSTGTVGTVQTNGTSKIESVGNGWYRCSLTVANFQSGFEIYVGLSNADAVTSYTGNGTGNILIQNAQVETGDIATDYILTTSAAVSVGPVANVPRLDYLGSTCPRLLLEPQRTNTLTYSEAFDNAAWTKLNATISANTTDTLDPSGYNGADKITDDTTNGAHIVYRFSTWDTTQRTASVYAKAGTSSKITIQNASTGQGAFFDLSTGAISALSAPFTATITAVGNGWYRITATHTAASSQTFAIGFFTGTATTNYAGTGSYAYLWGAQLEAGAYATSYIPTLAATATRGADACSKTGISSLIGQTEGTLYAEIVRTTSTATDGFWVGVNAGTVTDWIFFGIEATGARFYVRVNNVLIAEIYPTMGVGTHKMALGYKSGQIVGYIDGVQVFSSTATFTLTSLTKFQVGATSPSTDTTLTTAAVKQALLFTTRLTNAQLAELTTL